MISANPTAEEDPSFQDELRLSGDFDPEVLFAFSVKYEKNSSSI